MVLWIFACSHHFAGVWDAWGGSEARLLKNVERNGKDTIRTVVDCVLKLRQLRKNLIEACNDVGVTAVDADAESNQRGDVDVDGESDDESNQRGDVDVLTSFTPLHPYTLTPLPVAPLHPCALTPRTPLHR